MKTSKHITINSRNLQECQEHLTKALSSKSFLKTEGMSKDVPFHICPYEPAIHNEIVQLVKQLRNDLENNGLKILEINLYDLALDILKSEGDWEWILENESTMSREVLKEQLQGILDVESIITPAIAKMMEVNQFDIMLLSGIGEVFPYMRSHNILNNLEKIAKQKPTLMFFPGDYQYSLELGISLVLFAKLQDDKYYRASNILERAI